MLMSELGDFERAPLPSWKGSEVRAPVYKGVLMGFTRIPNKEPILGEHRMYFLSSSIWEFPRIRGA